MATAKAWIPKGTYTDIFTLQKYHGPMDITLNRELYDIPVLAKEGAIIPLSNDDGNSSANPKALEFWIFNGNNSFTLYEDEFDNYNYESGAYTEIPMTWNNASRTLTIGARKGKYNGMLEKRQFTVKTVDGNSKTVTYTGKKVTVKL